MKKISALLFASVLLAGCTTNSSGLKANEYSVIDQTSDKVIYNGHEYDYDITSGATVLPSRKADGQQTKPMDLKEKENVLYWTAEPPMGLIAGEYYRIDDLFGHFNSQYTASIDLVVNEGKIVHVEMDEKLSADYYNPTWANQYKRRTGYTWFQFSKPRTDTTKVTWANGITFLEWQILKNNSLAIDFDTVYGSSNSARDGFIPAVAKLKDMVKDPSGMYYLGLSKDLGDGLIGRLEVIFQDKNIKQVRYDEIFRDDKSLIQDEALKEYARQSKHDSVAYNEKTNHEFQQLAMVINDQDVKENKLVVEKFSELKEFENYAMLAKEIQPAIDQYLKNGYTHNVGKIAEKPEGYVTKENLINRQQDIQMEVVEHQYDEASQTQYIKVKVENVSDKEYTFKTGSFYMYVLNTENIYDTVADPESKEVTLAPKTSTEVELHVTPVLPTDTDMSLKYDGTNKVYYSFNIEK